VPPSLYHPKAIQKKFKDVSISYDQRNNVKLWQKMLKDGELEKEDVNYDNFRRFILREILEYPEDKVRDNRKRVELSARDENNKTIVCFELKGHEVRDLLAPQSGRGTGQETPFLQALTNMQRFPDIQQNQGYAICTNYEKFILIEQQWVQTKCHRFDISEIGTVDDKLKEFIGIFGYKSLVKNRRLLDLHKKSMEVDRKISKEFYKIFHQTRMMLITTFHNQVPNIDDDKALHYAQLFLNRLLFIFFASYNKLLPEHIFKDRIQPALQPGQNLSDDTNNISNIITKLFTELQNGTQIQPDGSQEIFGYNGGLFKDKIPNEFCFNDIQDPDLFRRIKEDYPLRKTTEITGEIGPLADNIDNLNEIITNLLRLNSFDFKSDISVKILGEIFENSISDIEQLQQSTTSQEKTEGIAYTNDYITKYICENTIIKYLSKKDANNSVELVKEYSRNIEELVEKVKKIKIIDPACGSGAFLLKAVDTLLEINRDIDGFQSARGIRFHQDAQPVDSQTQSQRDEYYDQENAKKIIERSIFGVDKNKESVEITKLSLFLKIAIPKKKLTNFDDNIKWGNSIIADSNVDPGSFDWEDGFGGKVKKGEFDIVIGNPPYVQSRDFDRISKEEKKSIKSNFPSTCVGMWDLYVPFINLGIELLKKHGNFGMIVKDTLGEVEYTTKLIDWLEKNWDVYQLDFFPEIKLFPPKAVHNKILFVKKIPNKDCTLRIHNNAKLFPNATDKLKLVKGKEKYKFKTQKFKIKTKNTIPLDNICIVTYGLRLNSHKSADPKFTKKDLVSEQYSSHRRHYTEGKYIDEFAIEKQQYIEWGTQRCPGQLVRPTYPEFYDHEKLLMSRQKRIVSSSDTRIICDNTIIVGILANELTQIENRNIKKYFQDLLIERNVKERQKIEQLIKKDSKKGKKILKLFVKKNRARLKLLRKKIEKNSEGFKIKYLLALLNSDLIRYFLKYNSGGKIDSYPDDWKKIPIKKISKSEQEKFVKISEKLNKKCTQFHSRKILFWELMLTYFRTHSNFRKKELPKSLKKFWKYNRLDFLKELEKRFKVELELNQKKEWQDSFIKTQKTMTLLGVEIQENKRILNELVYKLYGVNLNEISIINEDIHPEIYPQILHTEF